MESQTPHITQIAQTATAEIGQRLNIRTPLPLWEEMKIRAIRERVTAEQLANKAFEQYLASVSE